MSILEAIILGFVQGATEFLPVSSSGHLVVGQALLGIRVPGVAFEVSVHVATLASVALVYRRRLGALILGALAGRREAWRYVGLLFVATVPAALVGLGAGDFIESLFDSPVVTGIALLLTGGILWSSRGALGRNPAGTPGWKAALLIGLAQALAIVPGISRSGSTVVAGLWLGVDPEEAAAFSFLMAIPAILGAAVLELPALMGEGVGVGIPTASLLAGGVVAGITGIFAIWTFVAMLRHRSFYRFGPYCWALGAGFLLFLSIGG